MQPKTKHVRIRFEEPLYNFIARYGSARKMNVTDVVRNICTMIFMIEEFDTSKKALKSIFADSKRKEKFIAFLDKV